MPHGFAPLVGASLAKCKVVGGQTIRMPSWIGPYLHSLVQFKEDRNVLSRTLFLPVFVASYTISVRREAAKSASSERNFPRINEPAFVKIEVEPVYSVLFCVALRLYRNKTLGDWDQQRRVSNTATRFINTR